MMRCKSKPPELPEERPTDEVAALDTAGAATAGKGRTYPCHWRLKGRGNRKEKSKGVE
jgi:hypothetical protein